MAKQKQVRHDRSFNAETTRIMDRVDSSVLHRGICTLFCSVLFRSSQFVNVHYDDLVRALVGTAVNINVNTSNPFPINSFSKIFFPHPTITDSR